jgi:NTE family protein
VTPEIPKRSALVLSGGGLKGFAHIGVLSALNERGVYPALYAGTSIGALIASARVAGMGLSEMAHWACRLRRRDLFRINHIGMLLERMRCPSLYLERPLRDLCEAIAPTGTFHDVKTPLLVSTVDVHHGTQVVWGLPGMRDVRVVDAVYASCALPGFFPPGDVGGRTCFDGGTIDNLPAIAASHGVDAVIAVDVGSSNPTHSADEIRRGFTAIYKRAAQLLMWARQADQLAAWAGPPMLLIRPEVCHHNWFSFSNAEELITAGYRAAHTALDEIRDSVLRPGGVYPQRLVEVTVDRDKCIGCTACVAHAPGLLAMDVSGKAYVKMSSPVEWSRLDSAIIRQCPAHAIRVLPADHRRPAA